MVKIHRAFINTLQICHEDYIHSIEQLDTSIRQFVVENGRSDDDDDGTSYFFPNPPQSTDVTVAVDWTTQLQKVQHVHVQYEKFPERTVALLTTGTVAGKVAGAAAIGGAIKAMMVKLSSPFATKAAASAIGGKAVAGAATGATMGGPLGGAIGAVTGAAVGVGVDIGVNKGLSLLQRNALVKDIHECLDATQLEWEECLLLELMRVQSIWYEHADAALSSYESTVELKLKSDEK